MLLLCTCRFQKFRQGVELFFPESAVVLDPTGGFLHGLRREPAAMDAAIDFAAQQSGGFQHAKVLGDCRKRHIEWLGEFADRGFALRQAGGIGAGCEEAAKKSVRAQPPANSKQQAGSATTASAASPQSATLLPDLPLHPAGLRPVPNLASPIRDITKAELMAQVEQKFASGQTNYKAGHLEAARKDFDDAVDAMLQSGYDLDTDPKLSELFHRVVDTV